MARTRLEELNETVRLLDGNLGKLSVFMKNMEHISLGDSFCGEIT